MLEIPLAATANQAFQVVLGGQNCSLRLYTRETGEAAPMYCDLSVEQTPVCRGVPCLDAVPMPLYAWQGLKGRLVFVDMEGDEPPHWSGLGSRWKLLWLEPGEEA